MKKKATQVEVTGVEVVPRRLPRKAPPSEPDLPAGRLPETTRWIIWYLRRLDQAGGLYSKELYKKYQVSQPQLSCLLVLSEYGPLPLSKLANYILVKPSTVTGIVDRLEEKDLVRRVRSLADRRVITIELTKKGETLASQAPPPIPQSIIDGLTNLPPQKTQRIVESLAALVGLLDEPGGQDLP